MIYLYAIGILVANLVCHIFLVRLFDLKRKDEPKSNAAKIVEIILLIPPLAVLSTGFLVCIGLFLKSENEKND